MFKIDVILSEKAASLPLYFFSELVALGTDAVFGLGGEYSMAIVGRVKYTHARVLKFEETPRNAYPRGAILSRVRTFRRNPCSPTPLLTLHLNAGGKRPGASVKTDIRTRVRHCGCTRLAHLATRSSLRELCVTFAFKGTSAEDRFSSQVCLWFSLPGSGVFRRFLRI